MNTGEYIKIEKHIPVPEARNFGVSKYKFLESLEIGDSFIVDINTAGFSPKESPAGCYNYAQKLREKGGKFRDFRVASRLLGGTTRRPKSVRIWRVA